MVFPRLITGTFILFAVALSVPRLILFGGLCPRSYECASLHRAVSGPFQSNFNNTHEKICGDLASMANRPDLCAYRPEAFETDPWGYRNTLDVWNRKNEIIVFGDSFTLGQGNTQNEIPAVQLSQITGLGVYDGGGKFEFNYLRWLIDHFKSTPKTVVFLHLERHHHKSREIQDWDQVIDENSLVNKWKIFWDSTLAYNPIKILAGRLDKEVFTPGLFPNRYEETVPIFKLRDGHSFLFIPSSVSQYGDLRNRETIEDEGKYFEGFREKLLERQIKLVIALLPEKYSVYAPMVAYPPRPILGGKAYLDLLEDELHKRNLKVVNLLPLLKKEAATRFAQKEYLYWPDDSHWNASGIHFAMQAIAVSGLGEDQQGKGNP